MRNGGLDAFLAVRGAGVLGDNQVSTWLHLACVSL